MSDKTGIQWTDATWNPVTGCSKVSQGCKNCYALRDWPRLSAARPKANIYSGRSFTDVEFHPERLDQPLRWTKPRRVFVNSMSDLFHEKVPDAAILRVFDVMRQCANGWTAQIGGELGKLVPAHTFQILTKRPARMLDFCRRLRFDGTAVRSMFLADAPSDRRFRPTLLNVWLGVSVEDQATADERIPLLLQTPAAVRFVSYEPALGPVDFASVEWPNRPGHRVDVLRAGYWNQAGVLAGGPSAAPGAARGGFTTHGDMTRLDWLIVGGESGPGARPCDVAWIRSTVEECKAAGVACFVKQLGARPIACSAAVVEQSADSIARHGEYDPDPMVFEYHDRKGGDPDEWPEDLRVREMPA